MQSFWCRGFNVIIKKGGRIIVNNKCNTGEHIVLDTYTERSYVCDGGDKYYSHCLYICENEKCRTGLCTHCMRNYVLYGGSVSETVDENYKKWLKKNKHRKLNSLKRLKFLEPSVPEYNSAGGKSHQAWLADKNKKIKE